MLPSSSRYVLHTQPPHLSSAYPHNHFSWTSAGSTKNTQLLSTLLQMHLIGLWLSAFIEALYYLINTLIPPSASLLSPLHAISCPSASLSTPSYPSDPPPPLPTTPLFLIGVLSLLLGTYIRLDCFQALGALFTFDLTILPSHRLVTTRFYKWVRHPAYTGSMLLVVGITLTGLTRGSWVVECAGLGTPVTGLAAWIGRAAGAGGAGFAAGTVPASLSMFRSASVFPSSFATATAGIGLNIIFWVLWWAWTLSVGISRARAEDIQMRKVFGEEWHAYAANVPWWFFPGLF